MPASRLPLTNVEEGTLVSSGILTNGDSQDSPSILSEQAIALFTKIALGGSTGLLSSRVPRPMKDDWEAIALELEIHNLIAREHVTNSPAVRLVLTWQGEEALALERDSHRLSSRSIGARRKTSLSRSPTTR